MLAQSRVISLSIACPLPRAYEFLRTPQNFARWASGLGQSLEEFGQHWIARTPDGPVTVRFTPSNEFGVLDHVVTLPSGAAVYVPMRVIANGTGCEVMITLFRLPDMSDAKFEQDAQWISRDLATLKALLET